MEGNTLFLGFPVDRLFEEELNKINPDLVKYYIKKESNDYLIDTQHQEMRFFGKNLDKIATVDEVNQLGENIYSILKKIVPDFPYMEVSLYLFPTPHVS